MATARGQHIGSAYADAPMFTSAPMQLIQEPTVSKSYARKQEWMFFFI